MDVLRSQKNELPTIAEYQKGKLQKQKEEDLTTLETGRTKDVASLDKTQKDFEETTRTNQDTLGENWRKLSLNTQALSRARGITNSDFSQQQESNQMMEFNKGLRVLATSAQNVYKDFVDALTNTNDYYATATNKVINDSATQSADIDEWMRQSVVSIQQQERLTLGQKLSEIKSAAAKASELKLNIAQQAQTRQQNLEDWLLQTKVNFDNASKLAAQGNVSSAATTISDIAKTTATIQANLKNALSTGNASIQTDTNGQSYIKTYDPYNQYSVLGGGKVNTTDPYSYINLTKEGATQATNQLKQADTVQNLLNSIASQVGQ
jgi:hypothetical protein